MERIEYIDLIKGLGIILVLLGHLPINATAHMLIYSFHMPLFFFCSGLFFRPKTIVQGLKKDVKTILIPYIFFDSILIFTLMVKWSICHNSFAAAICQLNLSPLDSQCYSLYHTIWFFICMFFVKELFNIFSKIIANYRIIGWGGYLAALVLREWGIHLPFFIDSAFGMLFFYIMGYKFIHSKYSQKRFNTYILLLFLCLYFGLISLFSPEVNTRDNVYPWYLCFTALVPIFILYYLSANIFSYDLRILQFIRTCGVKSLFIFALHGPILEFLFPVLGHMKIGNYLQTFIALLIIIPICFRSDRIIMKYAPKLVGKKQENKT